MCRPKQPLTTIEAGRHGPSDSGAATSKKSQERGVFEVRASTDMGGQKLGEAEQAEIKVASTTWLAAVCHRISTAEFSRATRSLSGQNLPNAPTGISLFGR